MHDFTQLPCFAGQVAPPWQKGGWLNVAAASVHCPSRGWMASSRREYRQSGLVRGPCMSLQLSHFLSCPLASLDVPKALPQSATHRQCSGLVWQCEVQRFSPLLHVHLLHRAMKHNLGLISHGEKKIILDFLIKNESSPEETQKKS